MEIQINEYDEINPDQYKGNIDKQFIDDKINEIIHHIANAGDSGIIYVMSGTTDKGRYVNFTSDIPLDAIEYFMREALDSRRMIEEGTSELNQIIRDNDG